ncbi:hypothetical protein EYZ11_008030 [Aspergillus tanneri]|uniref:HTH CENPB-type domain-containing protein n=1 Tax=Aspergillus tanneri TaxID=1220188 RepID=A0A4S3JBT3_9EURO|nr:hypothetical protein EYZ11_008030 [Aspergillus tanneri]
MQQLPTSDASFSTNHEMDHNAHIAKAILELQSQERPKYAETVRKYNIDKSTLWRRFKGKTASIQDANSYSRQKLTSSQEKVLIEHVNKLSNRGIPPTPQMLKNIAEEIAGTTLGVNWASRFRKRHRDRLHSLYLRTIDHQRKAADNSRYFQHFFSLLSEKIEKYNIHPSNVYNFDEKGFQIGLSRSTKRVVTREALRRGKLLGASQDGNREFITLIAAICADYSHLPPALIYKGESNDLQESWLEDFNHSSEVAFFASTENGWSCDALGLHWLQRSCDKLMATSQGLIHLRKRNFWLLFQDAWNQAFTAKNIEAGWRATGLHPLNPDKVLSHISNQSDITPPQTASSDTPTKTPGSLRAIRRIARQFRKEGLVDPRVSQLSRAAEKLATKHEISQHENRDLLAALNLACNQGKRRKAMGLFNIEENGGQPFFFSPAKVELARQRQIEQEQANEQRKRATEDRRLQTALAREEKARESAKKKEQRAAARQALQDQRAQEKAERAAERKAKRAEKLKEATKQEAERAVRKAERQAIQKAKLQATSALNVGARGHKRCGSGDKNKGRQKRPRATGAQQRNDKKRGKAKTESNSLINQNCDPTNLTAKAAPVAQHNCRKLWRPVSQSLRSGRVTRPPGDKF